MLKHRIWAVSTAAAWPAAFGRLCVETAPSQKLYPVLTPQPPSGGCVLKQNTVESRKNSEDQPPSGGCVLKHIDFYRRPAARYQPPSGGCVLKQKRDVESTKDNEPAAFGRLCVETRMESKIRLEAKPSRLRAAVC